ncbi:MAG: hypothetical protein NZL93_03070, partial [Chthoniobacterales bacterium]|nr:hypothetical protein [Chthoniobacterales bacterium]
MNESREMNAAASLLPRWFNACLWGNSIALSWMWGLGLFFSVQFSLQYGLTGLLIFAIPNAFGLWVFGLVTHHLARREGGSESLAKLFDTWWRPFRVVFYFYQLLAVTLTVFAFIRYVWQPLGLKPDFLYLPLTMFVALMAGILFGEEFNIRRIKWSHGVIFLVVLCAVGVVLSGVRGGYEWGGLRGGGGALGLLGKFEIWGYIVPIVVGFLVGPWLDLQQWQRAIQMHRERCSIAAAYGVGAVEFFLLLIFHGVVALWALGGGGERFLREGLAPWKLGHDSVMRLLYEGAGEQPLLFGAYCVFLCGCLLTTLDSGYLAFRWFLQKSSRTSTSPFLALVPRWLVESPIPSFLLAGFVALVAAVMRAEIEYFMIFYATFFVGYAALGISRCFVPAPTSAIPHVKMFCIGMLALIFFAYGYFLSYPAFMIFGALAPLGYVVWLLIKPTRSEDFASGSEELSKPAEVGSLPVR